MSFSNANKRSTITRHINVTLISYYTLFENNAKPNYNSEVFPIYAMRPRLFETDAAWEIYSNLPPEQQTYANVARKLTEQLSLDPALTPQAISNRFIKAGLVEKKPRGAPKLKDTPLSGSARSQRKRHRDKVFAEILASKADS